MASTSKVHSGAHHGNITLQGVDTSARPYSDPQLDMRTWTPPKQEKSMTNKGVKLTPQQRSNIKQGITGLA